MAIGLAQSATYNLNIRQDQSAKRTVREIGLVDLLEWTYRDQRVHAALVDEFLPDSRVYSWLTASANPLAGLGRLDELGTHVDGGGRSDHKPHPDALRVHAEICKLARLSEEGQVAAGLIVEYAQAAMLPERPILPPCQISAARGRRGAVRMSYWEGDRQVGKRPGRTMRGGAGLVCRVGQACDLQYSQASDLDLYLIEHFDLWAVGLACLAQVIPTLSAWIVKEYQCPVTTNCTKPARRLRLAFDLHHKV